MVERHGRREEVDCQDVIDRLDEQGIDWLAASSVGKLSRYSVFGQKRKKAPHIWVVDSSWGSPPMSLEQATAVFQRYKDERRIARVYVAPDEVGKAREVLRL